MGTAAVVPTLRLPRPLAHQVPVLDDPSPRKLWRAGRRTGKSVGGRIAAIRGHGPRVNGKRLLPGMLDGANVAWLTKTYKQSKVVWRKLLKAFRPLEGIAVKIDREDHRIEAIDGRGAITVWSGHTRDAIDNLRGDAYDGVLLDEAAYIDLEYALNDVVEPALLDHGGWVFVFSSPNAAWDGNENRVAPSYFNRLCGAVLAGVERLWRQWHNRTEDNPRLDRVALAKLRERLGPESPTAQQELDASLIAGGLLALRIDRPRVEVAPFRVPAHWPLFGAFDWGYSHPWSFGLFATSEDGVVHLVDAIGGRLQVPKAIAMDVGALLERHGRTFDDLTYTAAGHDCWHESKAKGTRVAPIAEQVYASHQWALTKASIGRVEGLNNLRAYLADGKFKVHTRPGPLAALLCLETRISDPKRPEDVLKQDADHDGKGGDDDYDMVRYGLASRPLSAQSLDAPLAKHEDRARPYDYGHRRMVPHEDPMEAFMEHAPQNRHTTGFRVPRRSS